MSSLSPGDAARVDVAHPVLDELGTRLQTELKALGAAMRATVMQAVKVGAVLIEAKRTIGHGQWLGWVERNFKLHPRSAQNYMLLAERLPALSASNAKRLSHLGIAEALHELRKDGTRPAPAPRTPPAPTSRPAAPITIEGRAERVLLPQKPAAVVVPESITRLVTWLRTGSRLFEELDGGANAAELAERHSVQLNAIDLSHVESFVAGMMSAAKADAPPQLADREVQQIAEQVCHLLLRFREVSQKIDPEKLYRKFPAKLRHNLDIALAEANEFIAGMHAAAPRGALP
jgi:hypothetical protein